jgi:hypothetical protein
MTHTQPIAAAAPAHAAPLCGDGRRHAGHAIEQRQGEPGSGGEETGQGWHDARQGERGEQSRHGETAERDRDQIGDHADRGHGAEGVGRDGRREQRGSRAGGERPHHGRPAGAHPRGPQHARDGGDRQPGTDRAQGPGIEQEQQQHGEPDGAARRHGTLA